MRLVRASDVLLLVVSLVFTGAGVLLLVVGRGGKTPIGVITFFGLCSVVAAWLLAIKIGMVKNRAAVDVTVAGGVPIHAKRGGLWMISAGLAAAGSIMAWSGEGFGTGFQVISVIIAFIGIALLVALAAGRIDRQTLTFEPEGLRFGGTTGSYLVRWTNFERVELGDYQGHPMVFISLRDVAEVSHSAEGSRVPGSKRSVTDLVAKNQAWMRCDLHVMPHMFGVDPVVFYKLVTKYASEPERRAELAVATERLERQR